MSFNSLGRKIGRDHQKAIKRSILPATALLNFYIVRIRNGKSRERVCITKKRALSKYSSHTASAHLAQIVKLAESSEYYEGIDHKYAR